MEVESRGSTALTPDIVHEVFKWLLDNDGFVEAKPQNIADWFKMHQMVLKDIVVPALFSDIRSIVSGDAEKVWRIYRQVAAECITLARNENAEEYIDPESQTTLAINRVRLNTIAEVYLNVNHRELVFSDISAAAAAASFSDGRERTSFEPLRQAVEHFLISTELDTTTLESIQAIMKGADRAASKLDLTSISKTFARLGYDEKAFADALSLMIKIRRQTTVK
jgi:hypothetical protein